MHNVQRPPPLEYGGPFPFVESIQTEYSFLEEIVEDTPIDLRLLKTMCIIS